ncbi:helix-turn-helix domain-containing protein [Sphingobacterium cellulitidis]|uniref:helix-turn-helix domain-containing protein n=1 Tax=Sphingobacterium cellulitidis TaxID=1768011 RepID=UPI00296FAC61
MKVYRWRNGLSNKKLGKLLNVDGSTILAWENEMSIPRKEHLPKFEALYKYWQEHRRGKLQKV